MNALTVLNKIKEYASQNSLVGSVTLGDIYENMNSKMDIKYSVVNIDVANVQRAENLVTYEIYMYYSDRLVEDKRNWLEVKTTAENVLHSIINYANAYIGDVDENYTITFFEEQFVDYCAGAWVNFNLECPIELGDCTFESMGDDYWPSDDPLIEKLKEIIREYEEENAELAVILNEILHKLTGENND